MCNRRLIETRLLTDNSVPSGNVRHGTDWSFDGSSGWCCNSIQTGYRWRWVGGKLGQVVLYDAIINFRTTWLGVIRARNQQQQLVPYRSKQHRKMDRTTPAITLIHCCESQLWHCVFTKVAQLTIKACRLFKLFSMKPLHLQCVTYWNIVMRTEQIRCKDVIFLHKVHFICHCQTNK